MVTIAIGSYQQAQGDLLAVEGSRASIRVGSRILTGQLLTDLSKRPDLASVRESAVA